MYVSNKFFCMNTYVQNVCGNISSLQKNIYQKEKPSKRGFEFEKALVVGSISKSLPRTYPFPALLSNKRKRDKYIFILEKYIFISLHCFSNSYRTYQTVIYCNF